MRGRSRKCADFPYSPKWFQQTYWAACPPPADPEISPEAALPPEEERFAGLEELFFLDFPELPKSWPNIESVFFSTLVAPLLIFR